MRLLAESEAVPRLTALERIGLKVYIRYIFPFQLDGNYQIDEVTRVLRTAYVATQRRIPAMACEAVADEDAKQAGVLKLKKLHEGEIQDFVVQDLRAPDAFPSTYAELQSTSFPVAAFDADLLCPRSEWPLAGERLPISLVQANFIRGGLLLNWSVLHLVGDGTAYYTWAKVWAEECRRAQGLDIPKPVELPVSVVRDRERVMQPSGHNSGLLQNHPEYTLLPDPLLDVPPKLLARNHRAQVFYFSPAALQTLKADASPSRAIGPSDQTWISTNDALSALLWRTTMKVQHPLDTLKGNPESVFSIALNGRLRTDPPVHPSTLGCFLEFIAISAPVRKLIGSTNLADLALKIRKAILRADGQFTDDVVTLVDQLEDVRQLVPTSFLDLPGFNCMMTSWIKFDLYSLDWGSLLGHRIGAVRLPHRGFFNGIQVVLPMAPDGGIEVVVGVEEDRMDTLLRDPLWMKYAVPR
ncbi:transferase family-domain-containing protein [Aspergillus coremiiformis]|uniref:Transferase family-domain-containing protein n=1 Tax=Aspergillus coremiiformis TaxID=138285 RepID=A0A5N6YWN8_9EURO|nr:transferase family-domain-containing protein [Aspergillus coremiiformis]